MVVQLSASCGIAERLLAWSSGHLQDKGLEEALCDKEQHAN